MGKSTRKPSSAQRDKINIARAKALKKAGIISNKANLHSGSFISRGVLKKVRELGSLAGTNVKGYKAPKDIVARAKERGFIVVQGNKIVGPKTPQFRSLLKKGDVGQRAIEIGAPLRFGIQPIRGGMMEVIDLPHSIYDLHTLYEALGDDGLNALKLPDEVFAFNFHGNASYEFFANVQEMRDYLFQYKSIQAALSNKPENLQKEFQAISIIRFRSEDQSLFMPTKAQRRLLASARGIDSTGRTNRGRKPNNPVLAKRYNDKKAAAMRAIRAKMTKSQKKKQREKDRERMARNRSKEQ